MTHIITIANQKGGVGKTTTAAHVAHGLALMGKEVLLIDLDPQGQCAAALGLQQESGVFQLLVAQLPARQVIRRSGREGLWFLPGDKQTSTAQIVLNAQQAPISFLRDALRPLQKNGLAYIICDVAPSIGGLQEQALYASDLVLVPCATDFLAAQGAGQVMQTLGQLHHKADWDGRLLGVLPTFYDSVTKETQATLRDLQARFEGAVLDPIHRATALRECAAEGKTIFEIDGDSRPAKQYAAVVHKILEVS